MALRPHNLLSALLGLLAGNSLPPAPPPAPARKSRKNNGIDRGQSAARQAATKSWMDSFRLFRREWAPAGGGGRECARRRAQIERGVLITTEGLQRLKDRRVELSDQSLRVYGIDRAADGSEMTATAVVHSDGSMSLLSMERAP